MTVPMFQRASRRSAALAFASMARSLHSGYGLRPPERPSVQEGAGLDGLGWERAVGNRFRCTLGVSYIPLRSSLLHGVLRRVQGISVLCGRLLLISAFHYRSSGL